MEKEPPNQKENELLHSEKRAWGWIEKHKEKTLRWAFIAILVLAFMLRLYYFAKTYNQPVWWDEGDYMNLARAWAFGKPEWPLNPLRPVLFPLLVAGLMKLGFSEWMFRLIPLLASLGAIILVYNLGKMFYSQFIGVVAAFILAVFWSFMFFTFRLLVDVPVAFLYLLSLYLFWKGFEAGSQKHLLFFGPALMLAFLMKFTAALLGFAILVYLFITKGFQWLKNKTLWKTAIFGFIVALPYFIFQWAKFGSPFAFYIIAVVKGGFSDRTWLQTFVNYITTTIPLMHFIYLILFIIGLLTLMRLFFCLDLIKKPHHHQLRADLIILLSFAAPLLYLITLGYGEYIEERYLFLSYPLMFIVAAKGLHMIYSYLRKLHHISAVVVVIILVLIGGYQNLAHADTIIQDKISSFKQVKDAGVYIKANSNPDDLVVSFHTQAELQYSAGRRVLGIPGANETDLVNELKKQRVVYYVSNVFVQPDQASIWKLIFPYQHPELFEKVLFFEPYLDKDKMLPILTVFKVKN